MKNQYFGDINDFYKYGLLRALSHPIQLRLCICWMLTEPDKTAHGDKTHYIDTPGKWRPLDPEVFDLLATSVRGSQRDVGIFEKSGLLPGAVYHGEILTDSGEGRKGYFDRLLSRSADCDLVFFDPDNGLETRKPAKGEQGSSKYLYHDEVEQFCGRGQSVLVFQYTRFHRDRGLLARRAAELRRRCGGEVSAFQTPHVVFLLAAQERHLPWLGPRVTSFRKQWEPEFVILEA